MRKGGYELVGDVGLGVEKDYCVIWRWYIHSCIVLNF